MIYPAAGPVHLRTNLADYPATMALKEGRVSSPLITFDYCGPKVAHDGFKAMVRDDAFDAGELAIVTYLQAKVYNKPYVILPAPVLGRLQHHCIGYSAKYGELSPKDIEGKRVGVRTYAQTTGLWVRGILQHGYGVDLDRVIWCTLDDAHLAEHEDPPNCERLPSGSKLDKLMLEGDLAAAVLGDLMPNDPDVRRLIPDHVNAAQEWRARTQVLPINHIFTVRQELALQRPDVVRELFRLLVESRNLAPAAALATMPPFGVEDNRKGLQLAIDWALEQKIIPHGLSVDDLFCDVTRELSA